jgi:hypothetical protein
MGDVYNQKEFTREQLSNEIYDLCILYLDNHKGNNDPAYDVLGVITGVAISYASVSMHQYELRKYFDEFKAKFLELQVGGQKEIQ